MAVVLNEKGEDRMYHISASYKITGQPAATYLCGGSTRKNEIRITLRAKKNLLISLLGARRRLAIMESGGKTHGQAFREPDGNYIAGMSARQQITQDNGIYGASSIGSWLYTLSCSEPNASMGKRYAPAPTRSSCRDPTSGRPDWDERRTESLEEETVLNNFITAGGLALLVTRNATVSGAEGGCQAECGEAGSHRRGTCRPDA